MHPALSPSLPPSTDSPITQQPQPQPPPSQQVAYGSKDEVERFEQMVGTKFAVAHPDVAAKAHA